MLNCVTKNSTTLHWLLFILAFGVIWRVIFLNAPLQSDDTTYLFDASNLSAELFKNAKSQCQFRLGILAPLAILQKIFGYSLASYYLYSLGSALFLLVMIYLTANKTGGFLTAVISSLLFACSFFGLYQATNLLPDIPNLAFLLASYLVFINIEETRGTKYLLILFLSALLGFCSYLVRAPNLVFLLAIPVYEFFTKKSLKSTCLFSIFFFMLWFGECIFYQTIADDFFLRVKMIPKGSSLWVKFMPEISWQLYIQEPITRLYHTFSGSIILWGGLAGTIMAIWKNNRAMLALLTGGLLIFIIYSYSVTSFFPLRRALPLNTRYIVAFTAVFTIATGYALSSLKPILDQFCSKFKSNIIFILTVITIIMFQVKELPRSLPDTILFKYNSYFLADQILKDSNKIGTIKGNIYAYPHKDFNMYPNFSKLDLKRLSFAEDISAGNYYLYSRKRIRKDLHYGYWGRDEKILTVQKLFLLPEINSWKYIINTQDIALVNIPSFDFNNFQKKEIVSLEGSFFLNHWGKPENVKEGKRDDSSEFFLNKTEKPIYIFTFPGRFSLPPHEDITLFDKLKPNEVYELIIHYRIQSKMSSLLLFLSQYDNVGRVNNETFTISSTPGSHIFTTYFSTFSTYSKFRLFFRIDNLEQGNMFAVEKILINKLVF